MKAYKDLLTESSSTMKKPKTAQFDIPKTDTTTQEQLDVVDDSPLMSSMIIEEENPSPSSSPTKTPLASLTKTPPSSSIKTPPPSPTKTPPPSPTKSPPSSLIKTPPPSPTKTPIPSPTKTSQSTLT
ncbi:unnamed protein product, partial [Adineta steineri]